MPILAILLITIMLATADGASLGYSYSPPRYRAFNPFSAQSARSHAALTTLPAVPSHSYSAPSQTSFAPHSTYSALQNHEHSQSGYSYPAPVNYGRSHSATVIPVHTSSHSYAAPISHQAANPSSAGLSSALIQHSRPTNNRLPTISGYAVPVTRFSSKHGSHKRPVSAAPKFHGSHNKALYNNPFQYSGPPASAMNSLSSSFGSNASYGHYSASPAGYQYSVPMRSKNNHAHRSIPHYSAIGTKYARNGGYDYGR